MCRKSKTYVVSFYATYSVGEPLILGASNHEPDLQIDTFEVTHTWVDRTLLPATVTNHVCVAAGSFGHVGDGATYVNGQISPYLAIVGLTSASPTVATDLAQGPIFESVGIGHSLSRIYLTITDSAGNPILAAAAGEVTVVARVEGTYRHLS